MAWKKKKKIQSVGKTFIFRVLCVVHLELVIASKKYYVLREWGWWYYRSYNAVFLVFFPLFSFVRALHTDEKKRTANVGTDNLQQRITAKSVFSQSQFFFLRYAFVAIIIVKKKTRKNKLTECGSLAPNAQKYFVTTQSVKELTHTHTMKEGERDRKKATSKPSECVWKDVHFSSNTVNQT